MLTMKITFRLALLTLLSISAIFSLTYETKTIDFNSIYLEELKGSQMKFYSVNLDSKIKENDLLIDARRTDSKDSLFESPVVLVSLVKIFFIKNRNPFRIQTRAPSGSAVNLEWRLVSFQTNIYLKHPRFTLESYVNPVTFL